MTFTIEDALISPMGLAVLSGAGLSKSSENNLKHVHCTIDANVVNGGVGTSIVPQATITLAMLQEELGITDEKIYVCNDKNNIPVFGTILDASGAGVDYIEEVNLEGGDSSVVPYSNSLTIDSTHPLILKPLNSEAAIQAGYVNKTVKFDLYVFKSSGVQEIEIKAQDFGGYFYLEAQTLFRREDTGEDMAAEIIIPKAKVQSNMTISLSASGDPSTYTFTFDAFPAYTKFDRTKKVMCAIQIIGEDKTGSDDDEHKHKKYTYSYSSRNFDNQIEEVATAPDIFGLKASDEKSYTEEVTDPTPAVLGNYIYNTTESKLKVGVEDSAAPGTYKWEEVTDSYSAPTAAYPTTFTSSDENKLFLNSTSHKFNKCVQVKAEGSVYMDTDDEKFYKVVSKAWVLDTDLNTDMTVEDSSWDPTAQTWDATQVGKKHYRKTELTKYYTGKITEV